jgi:hypothetical protein
MLLKAVAHPQSQAAGQEDEPKWGSGQYRRRVSDGIHVWNTRNVFQSAKLFRKLEARFAKGRTQLLF